MKRIITKMYLCLLAFCIAGGISAQTQNSMTEVIPFKTIDGKIIVEAAINGEVADFVLDLSGHNALLPEALKKLRIDTGKNGTFSAYQDFVFKQVPVGKVYEMATVAIGNNTFNNDLPAFTLEDEPYLRKLGVMGVLSGAIFRTSVLTIDMQRKKLTITQPYRPSYMKLNYRENFELITGLGIVCPISIQGKPVSLVLDTWSEGLVNLTEKDFNTWSTQYTKGTNQKVSNGYKEATQEEESLILPETMFVKTKIEDAMAVKNPYLKRSVLGKKILDYGIISIDYIHQKIYFQSFDMVPIPEAEAKVTETKVEDGKLILHRKNDKLQTKAYHGLYRSLFNNMVKGVSEGFSKTLVINGVGYKAEVQGQILLLSLGYSNDISVYIPEGLTVTVDQLKVKISGASKELVGEFAAQVRRLRGPEPYKGKGIRYEDEVILRKVGKTGVK